MYHSLLDYDWLNPPRRFMIKENEISFTTHPKTDYWQRTYYGFQNDNGHLFAFPTALAKFSYSFQVSYAPKGIYDQAGVMAYLDSKNWFKASIEYENETISRLGSVVTNSGFSDWATTDINTQPEFQIFFRLSRRGNDFLAENASDGIWYHQMRIFHLDQADSTLKLGVYACSPSESSFEVTFSNFEFGDCLWEPYADKE
jgi:regulation of enolase protein 1 (concanavalin A-like superfamily)